MFQETGEVSTYTNNPNDVVFEWSIKNFLSLLGGDGGWCTNPEFFFGSETWRLIIYPNGWSGCHTTGHVDLRLLRLLSGPPLMQEFSLSLKTVNGEKDHEEHSRTFFWEGCDYHDHHRFLSRSELTSRHNEILPSGVLTLLCSMKTTIYAEIAIKKRIKENCKEASTQTEKENDDGSLSQDFKKVLLEGLDHELILRVGDKKLRAHRDVLRARSHVFKSMLSHDMAEKNSGIIDIPDCDPLAMEQFLSYVYSGTVETLDQSNMLNLYYIADKYDMKGLKKECSDFVKESLSQTNICDVIQLALNHSDSSLLEAATKYFTSDMLGIMRTVEWQVFMKHNSTVANELLIKSVENLNHAKP